MIPNPSTSPVRCNCASICTIADACMHSTPHLPVTACQVECGRTQPDKTRAKCVPTDQPIPEELTRS